MPAGRTIRPIEGAGRCERCSMIRCVVRHAACAAALVAYAQWPGVAAAAEALVDPVANTTSRAEVPGYAGLRLRQAAEGVVVAGVQPGPLGGDGFTSPSIWRGDVIVSIDGQQLDAAGFAQLIRAHFPGDRLRVVYRRGASADPYAAIARGDASGEERVVEIVLDDAARWRPLVGTGLAPGRSVAPALPGEFEPLIRQRAGELGVRTAIGGLDALIAYLGNVQDRLLAPDTLTVVAQTVAHPLALDRVEAALAAQVRPLAARQSLPSTLLALHALILGTLALPDLQAQSDIATRLSAARSAYVERAERLMRAMRADVTAQGPALPEHLQVMRASPEVMPLAAAMLPRVARYAAELEQFARDAMQGAQPIPPELAERVQAAVGGPVLAARVVDGQLWIVGGAQANRYDMDRIAAVFDPGGDDVYAFTHAAEGVYQLVIDASGDDVYQSAGDFAGPAAGVFSVSVVWDRGGNDRYLSHHLAALAAGLFGVGVLIDDSGDDRYLDDTSEAGWAEGAAMYGAGILIDRGGDDLYDAQLLSQGAGGPGGIGLVVEGDGHDTYLANGPHVGSAYGTAEVYAGLSQGFGVGIRDLAPGGLGAIYDFAGDDFYSVGEFGQGTGYFQGLGILHDASGDDRYVGSRYAQGTGVHQAAGILVDDVGDDTYLCPGPAAQGAAWDQGAGMLLDRAGNDRYAAAELAQGAAAQQALGVLVDLGGEDEYACARACQGLGGDNRYHHDASGVYSFSAFVHLGGAMDRYTQSRANGSGEATGARRPDDPGAADCCGLFVDD